MDKLTKQLFELTNNRLIFKAGRGQYLLARQAAQACAQFALDDEDEQIDDVPRSCYNCQYRRWAAESFECLSLKIS